MTVYNYNDNRSFSDLYLSISYYIYIFLKNILFTVIFVFSFFALVFLKNNKDVEDLVRDKILYVTYPYMAVRNVFEYVFHNIDNYLVHFRDVDIINKNLVKQNFDLKTKLFGVENLEKDNQELKNILNIVLKQDKSNYTLAKINIISNSSFVSKIETKSNPLIKNNDLVVDDSGNLVGKIINSDSKKSDILLAVDPNFKIGAILADSMNKVILSGNGSNLMDINYFLGQDFNIVEGERVITSNDANVNQAGINIGIIKKIDGKFFVELTSNLTKLDYVVILHKKEIDIIKQYIDFKVYDILKDTEKEESINNKLYNTTIDDSIRKELNDI